MMMRTKDLWLGVVLLAIASLIAFSGCELAKKKPQQSVTPEKERAMQEEEQRKTLEGSLAKKSYPGIEGEVWESTLLKDVHFDFDKYDLTEEARGILNEDAKVLLRHDTLKIQIEGHCDERGNSEYNLALGEKRAVSVKHYLVKLGVQGDRLSTISYGEEMPVDRGHNEQAWAKNRRAHFVILSR